MFYKKKQINRLIKHCIQIRCSSPSSKTTTPGLIFPVFCINFFLILHANAVILGWP